MNLIKVKKQLNKLKEIISVDKSDPMNIQYSSISEPKKESSDTVYGQGTNPKPEDETYLALLKGTSITKPKVKINK